MKSIRIVMLAAPTDSIEDAWLPTEGFAALNGVRDQTVRKRFCQTGSYFGAVPRKLASGRLVWPAVQVLA